MEPIAKGFLPNLNAPDLAYLKVGNNDKACNIYALRQWRTKHLLRAGSIIASLFPYDGSITARRSMTFISASVLDLHGPISPHRKYSNDLLSPVCSERRAVMGSGCWGCGIYADVIQRNIAISPRGVGTRRERAAAIIIVKTSVDGLAQRVGHKGTAVSHRLRRPCGRVASGLVLQFCVKFSTDNQYNH